MALKLLMILATLTVVVSPASVANGRRQSLAALDDQPEPNYSYGYTVQEDRTGDHKSQHESRQGDRVEGQYRLRESDGTERIVDYTADDRNGFRAVVRHEPERHQQSVQAIRLVPLVPEYDAAAAAKRGWSAGLNSRWEGQHYIEQPWILLEPIRHN
ncbi:larval cuticle protein A2B-like [Malaya genurostris]|uniref:larval cuticle protein A2B-like n=1 Tax=Malaya genurostris TaxID=325434 RepID=UPI0026F37F2C|nr:larval cuticle protein A2B-like [Malaya genurostris]